MKICWLVLFFTSTFINCLAQKPLQALNATIIGSGSPVFNIERAGPSVLINYNSTYILVDMGNGTQANLNKIGIKTRKLDGLLITHHHLDHNEELTPIFINSLLGNKKFTVAGPKSTSKYIENILDIYHEDISYRLERKNKKIEDAKKNYEIKELSNNSTFKIGEITISCTPVNHSIETLAYRFDAGGNSIVISGDLTYSESLPVLAKNADYLIIDSGTLTNKKARKNKTSKRRGHLNLNESGRMAKSANVTNLVLTHFTKNKIDTISTKKVLSEKYSGNVVFAYDLLKLPLN